MEEVRKAKVLIVDDVASNRMLLKEMLEPEYEILEASDGEMAIRVIMEYGQDLSLILLDVVLPEMDGIAVLEQMNKERWMIESIPVIIISAERDDKILKRAFELGTMDFITRPFNSILVRHRIQNTIELSEKQKRLEGMVVNEVYENAKRSSLMLMVLSHIVEYRNRESGMRAANINAITKAILKQLEKKSDRYHLTESGISDIAIASSLHDIGKIAIPEAILNKPGRLSEEEYAMVKTHSMEGARLLEEASHGREDNLIKMSYQICRWHHERYDGSGYPDGLVGDEIPIAAQVVGLADVYDALTSARVYKPPYSHRQAVEMIQKGECGVFNPLLLECFNEISDQIPNIIATQEENLQAQEEIRRFTDEHRETLGSDNFQQTLRKLEYEQEKAKFYASITHDILFEYSMNPPMLTVSAYGCSKFGLQPVIYYPERDEKLAGIISWGEASQLLEKVRRLPRESMRARMELQLKHGGTAEWNRIIAKPVFKSGKERVMTGMIGVITDIHDDYEKMRQLERLASTDEMTGLTNKGAMVRRVREILEDRRGDSNYGMMILDVDNLKIINDMRGHSTGDDYLKLVASQLRNSTRSCDLTGRIGGDEFMIFFHYNNGDPDAAARSIYGRIINVGQLAAYQELELEKTSGFSVSAGYVTVEQVGRDYQELFNAADHALYQVKRSGKGYCLGYVPDKESARRKKKTDRKQEG